MKSVQASIEATRFFRGKYVLNSSVQKFSTLQAESPKPSYLNRLGNEPLKFLNVGQVLKITSINHPDREAIVSCNEKVRLTFSEALNKADRMAAGFLNLGLVKGDSVAIWSPNYEFWYVSMLAIARAGLVCVALNPAYQLPELDYCLQKVGVKAIIAPEEFRKQQHYQMLMELASNSPTSLLRNIIIASDKKLPKTIRFQDFLEYSSESDVAEVEKMQSLISPDSCSNIQFTSGTTGKPKAARLSHFSLVNCGYDMGKQYFTIIIFFPPGQLLLTAINLLGKRQELDKNYGRICVNNPLFHGYGINITIMNCLNHGATMVLPSPHFSPIDSLAAIVDEKCNIVYGTPTMFVDLISKQRELNISLPNINIANTAGAICTPNLVKDIQRHLNVRNVRSIYGLTETTAAVFQSKPDDSNETLENSVGYISDHSEVKVIDGNGNAVPFGQPGELCVRGYMTLMDYFADDEKTKEVLGADRWFKTGDQFVLHENGYANIVGRLKEMIIRGGENIYPREIEDYLNTHPDVEEAHVVGIPDERLGEEVGAFIRLKSKAKTLTQNDIKTFCQGRLAHFKVPRYVVVVDEFPRTLSGKIQKFKFLDVFALRIAALKSL